jgi:hypothetical protein
MANDRVTGMRPSRMKILSKLLDEGRFRQEIMVRITISTLHILQFHSFSGSQTLTIPRKLQTRKQQRRRQPYGVGLHSASTRLSRDTWRQGRSQTASCVKNDYGRGKERRHG